MNVVGEQAVVFVHPNGSRHPGRIALGEVFRASGGEYRCEVILEGLDEPRAISGDSTLQALLLAARFAAQRLHDFCAKGGRIVYPADADAGDDTDVALEAVFGPMFRSP